MVSAPQLAQKLSEQQLDGLVPGQGATRPRAFIGSDNLSRISPVNVYSFRRSFIFYPFQAPIRQGCVDTGPGMSVYYGRRTCYTFGYARSPNGSRNA